MEFDTPIPFTEALDRLLARNIFPSAADSVIWRNVPVELRERAFFSSRVESARLLQAMRDQIEDFLAVTRMPDGSLKAHSRAQFVADMRELAIREGLGRIDPETGEIDPNIRESDLTDIRSSARQQLIFDTITESSQEYGYFQQGQAPEILDVFPCQRFIRIRPVNAPRDYHEAALGEVRRKDDLQFWLSLNRDFGVPWGPWGFNSGCGTEDVDREESIDLGVIRESDTIRPIERDFNQGLQAGTRDLSADILAALTRATGGTSANGTLTPRQTPANPAGALALLGIDPGLPITPAQARALIDELREENPVDFSEVVTTLKGARKSGLLTKTFVQDAVQDALSFFPPDLARQLPKITVQVKAGLKGAAGSYSEANKILSLSASALTTAESARKTILHEMLHWWHDHGGTSIDSTVKNLWKRRTRGESLAKLRPWNKSKITGFRDKWMDADGDEYAGRIYSWEAGGPKGSEVLTRHLEKLSNPDSLARHWNHLDSDGNASWRDAFTELLTTIYP